MGTASRSDENRGNRQLVLASTGFSLLYAVCVSFFYFTPLAARPDFSAQAFDNVLNPAMFLTGVALALLVKHVPAKRQAIIPAIGYLSLAAAVALLFAAGVAQSSPLSLAAAVLAGAGMSLAAPFYFASLADFGTRSIALVCGVMSLAGMALDMAWALLPPMALLALQLAALVASAMCLAQLSREGNPERDRSDDPKTDGLARRDLLNTFLVPGLGTFALSIVYGIIDAAAAGAAASPDAAWAISKVGGIVAAVAFTLYFAVGRQSSTTLLFNVVFGALATGVLFLPFLPGNYTVALNIFAATGWKLVMLSLFYLVVITYAHDRTRLLAAIALAYVLPRLGLFIGLNIALVLHIDAGADFVRTTAVAFFLLYLILMVVWLVNAHERRQALGEAQAARERLDRFAHSQEDFRRARCAELAAEHGLTNRETDILLLLAQGRDAQFVSDALYLSRNTVKSYQKSIYAKLGVHSKQEIIELVAPSL